MLNLYAERDQIAWAKMSITVNIRLLKSIIARSLRNDCLKCTRTAQHMTYTTEDPSNTICIIKNESKKTNTFIEHVELLEILHEKQVNRTDTFSSMDQCHFDSLSQYANRDFH